MEWWQWILVVLGGIFLIMIFAVVGFIIWVRWQFSKIKDFLNQMQQFGEEFVFIGPVRIDDDDPAELEQHPELRATADQVRALGFEMTGPKNIVSAGLMCMVGVDASRGVIALLTDASDGVRIDIGTIYADGTSSRHMSHDTVFDAHPDCPRVVIPDASPEQLLHQHLAAREDKPKAEVSRDNVVDVLVDHMEDEMFWRASRGGLTNEETRRLAKSGADATGATLSQEEVRQRQELMRTVATEQAAQYVRMQLREALQQSSDLEAARFQQIEDRLLFVFDTADTTELVTYLEPQVGESDYDADENMIQLKVEELESGPRRETFKQLNAAQGPGQRLELLTEVTASTPLASVTADVYVMPRID